MRCVTHAYSLKVSIWHLEYYGCMSKAFVTHLAYTGSFCTSGHKWLEPFVFKWKDEECKLYFEHSPRVSCVASKSIYGRYYTSLVYAITNYILAIRKDYFLGICSFVSLLNYINHNVGICLMCCYSKTMSFSFFWWNRRPKSMLACMLLHFGSFM